MVQAEAPQFIHTEVEREQMLTRMQDIAGRELFMNRDLAPEEHASVARRLVETYQQNPR